MTKATKLDRSFGEVAALAKRATRGAGYDWGACEDASAATEWLSRHGLPGVEALSQALSTEAVSPLARIAIGKPWMAAEGTHICPLMAGAALTDHIQHAADDGGITILGLRSPLLIVGCVGAYGEATGRYYKLEWDEILIEVGRERCLIKGSARDLSVSSTDKFKCTEIEASPMHNSPRRPIRRSIAAGHWNLLEQLAAQTYAPATAASRSSGAGPADC
ncbi:MAG: DUF3726 domain-containing protein [Alphaproteobacteria bacterium]|jgi:hypothetical protein|nr:DUF3726 domain-containing protein [Alphaproteobacteria bacterium]